MVLRPGGVAPAAMDTSITLHGLESAGGIGVLIRLFNEAYVGAPDYNRVGWMEAAAIQASKSYDPSLVWIACGEDRPIGFCMARLDDNGGRITGVGVLPQCRRQGIGSRLLAGAIEELQRRGARHIRLSVAASSPDCIRLYEHLGFEVQT